MCYYSNFICRTRLFFQQRFDLYFGHESKNYLQENNVNFCTSLRFSNAHWRQLARYRCFAVSGTRRGISTYTCSRLTPVRGWLRKIRRSISISHAKSVRYFLFLIVLYQSLQIFTRRASYQRLFCWIKTLNSMWLFNVRNIYFSTTGLCF